MEIKDYQKAEKKFLGRGQIWWVGRIKANQYFFKDGLINAIKQALPRFILPDMTSDSQV